MNDVKEELETLTEKAVKDSKDRIERAVTFEERETMRLPKTELEVR